MYRFTKDTRYLEQAVKIAEFILNHPNMPEDLLPYWDYNAPDIPNTLRDASAAAIMASAFIELSVYAETNIAKLCLETAKIQIKTLSSPEYLSEPNTNCNFILKHSVGNYPGKGEIDVPLTYADYYYVEALVRYKKYVLKK